MKESKFFNLGVKLASAAHNKSAKDISAISGFVDTVNNVKEANYGFLQRMVCKIAADVLEEAGMAGHFDYHLLTGLSKSASWLPELDKYSDAVLTAFGKVASEYEKENETSMRDEVVKKASGILPGILSSTAKITPDVVKAMALAGALGGSATGGLYWLLNRHSEEDEDKAEQVKAKIDYYNRISKEIKNQLGTIPSPPGVIADKVQEIVNNRDLF